MGRPNPPKNLLGVRIIRDFARMHKLRLCDMARASEIPEGSIGGILSGRNNPPEATVLLLWGHCRSLAFDKLNALRKQLSETEKKLHKNQTKLDKITAFLQGIPEL